jgi:hypothetical protein
MSLVISKVFTYDTDAGNYIQAVEAADGQALEAGTRQAINNFVIGCKQDGIWSAIKASCILSGARTLNGALQPLAGTAPTNFNFVSGDYNRKTGLVGNGSSKYLNSGYAATLRDSVHMAAYTTEQATIYPDGPTIIGTSTADGSSRSILYQHPNNNAFFWIHNAADTTYPGVIPYTNGFRGVARSSSTALSSRIVGTTYTKSISAVSLIPTTFYVFSENVNNSAKVPNNYRIALYSVGESLDLALLDARVTALITAFGVAIP